MNMQLRAIEVVFSKHYVEWHLENPLKASKTREKAELYWEKFLQLMGLLAQVAVISQEFLEIHGEGTISD